MAATTLDSYSDSYDAFINNADQGDHSAGVLPPANQSRGKVSVGAFEVTLASQAAGEDIGLVKIPKGARILTGKIYASATLDNSAEISVGIKGADDTGFIDAAGSVSDSVTFFKAAATQGTAEVGFALTQALGQNYLTEKEVWLTLTTSVGTVATEVISGFILYVVD